VIDRLLGHPAARVALLDAERGTATTYGELADRVKGAAARLSSDGRALVFLAMGADAGAVVLYLACLKARLPVCLAELAPVPLARLAAAYRPGLVIAPEGIDPPPGYRADPGGALEADYRMWRREDDAKLDLHPDLAALLTTSGSTGNPKLVRLAARNLAANARSIASYLGLGPDERAIQSLPSHYSYGLSVVNSHLWSGGSVVFTAHSFMRPEFWKAADAHACTSFAGVPYMYEVLHRLRFDPAAHPSIQTYTQAGGALRLDLTEHFHRAIQGEGGPGARRFFVMYGQTEAAARIAYVPPERLAEKIGAIGIAIPEGRLSLAPIEGRANRGDPSSDDAGEPGGDDYRELVYEGPNVMLGYAETAADLALGDVQCGMLRTGDLGAVDGDGFFSVRGRLKRFAKLFGRRVSLEDIEKELESRFPARVAALDGGDRIVLWLAREGGVDAGAVTAETARYLGVPPAAVVVRLTDVLPMTAAGKKDYRALAALATGSVTA
jgi:acyl-CoA synthetase (AMP-forming)/AMP-acid ligase II